MNAGGRLLPELTEKLRKFLTMIVNYLIICNNVTRMSLVTIVFPRKIMRLKKFEIQIIKKAIHSLEPDAAIYLFGSRTDDSKKGGDIDLLILSKRLTYGDKLKIKQMLFEKMEEQKIDLVIASDAGQPFVRLALEQGVRLE